MSTQGETSYEAFNHDESRLLLALGALATGSAHAAWPIGPYPRVDNWGIPVCKSFDSRAEYNQAVELEPMSRRLPPVGRQTGE